MHVTLWFNHNFSSIHNVIELVRDGAAKEGVPEGLKVVLSHGESEFVAAPLADVFEVEPKLDERRYVDYCLEMCRKHKVTVFWPWRGAAELARRRLEFEVLGVAMIVSASPETQERLKDKVAFYENLALLDFPLPAWRWVESLADFEAACAALGGFGRRLCFKPAKSIFGLGFKVLREWNDPLAAFLSGDAVSVSPDEAAGRLARAVSPFKLLVMEYLEGPEYSLDCLCREGRLLRITIQRKPVRAGGVERLVKNEELAGLAERLVRHFVLNGICNIQFKEQDGHTKLLEINPRMAGGLYYSCLAGINYPYWALRLALGGEAGALPEQHYDLMVHQAQRPFIYAV